MLAARVAHLNVLTVRNREIEKHHRQQQQQQQHFLYPEMRRSNDDIPHRPGGEQGGGGGRAARAEGNSRFQPDRHEAIHQDHGIQERLAPTKDSSINAADVLCGRGTWQWRCGWAMSSIFTIRVAAPLHFCMLLRGCLAARKTSLTSLPLVLRRNFHRENVVQSRRKQTVSGCRFVRLARVHESE